MNDQNDYNRQMIEQFRATRSTTGTPLDGRPMLLLTTTGAKSGQQRTTPLMFMRDGERPLIIASNMGAPKHPDWYHNLVAQPSVTVEVGAETYEASAVVLAGTERQRCWDALVKDFPFFIEHQQKTTREIPLVVLERTTA